MGDIELLHLLEKNQLPNTQPYQAIVEGDIGRTYMEKHLTGQKSVDTNPTTVVEFTINNDLLDVLWSLDMYKKQHKIEDGCISMGLGFKAGKGLDLFNRQLLVGEITYRIVKVRRTNKKS